MDFPRQTGFGWTKNLTFTLSAELWPCHCVVGIGRHARTKIIPALQANGQQIVGLVSTQSPDLLPCAPVFNSIEAALEALPTDTVFIITTPPSVHFKQVRAVLEAGRDVIVEKPAFVTSSEAREIANLCKIKKVVIVESLMHRYTLLYRRLMDYWNAHLDRIESINAEFLIPEMPAGTFRQERGVASSCLYDMGCYLISLLADFKLPLDGLQLKHVSNLGHEQEMINIGGVLSGIEISIRIGVASTYMNFVELRTCDGETTRFWPLFYGRSGERCVSQEFRGTIKKVALEDGDAFQSMFNVSRAQWLVDQTDRSAQMIEVASSLERLGHDLMTLRGCRQ